MSLAQAYLQDVMFNFRKHKDMTEKAASQLTDEEFFQKPTEPLNSVALIVKHLSGNLKSRWTDFLGTDGDKPWRDRDGEFIIGPQDTRTHLLAAWEEGWDALFRTLGSLGEADLLKHVAIRDEEHTVLQAIDRGLTHVAYHTGQILYVARLVKQQGWQWITIPPGQSKADGRQYLNRAK